MNRAETTRFLGELLKSDRFRGMGKYWASEVSVDAFTAAGKGGRVKAVPRDRHTGRRPGGDGETERQQGIGKSR